MQLESTQNNIVMPQKQVVFNGFLSKIFPFLPNKLEKNPIADVLEKQVERCVSNDCYH